MTPEQEIHLSEIISDFSTRCDAKYRKGQAEHGGNLFDLGMLQLIDNGLEEAVDQFVYLKTLRDKIVGELSEDMRTFARTQMVPSMPPMEFVPQTSGCYLVSCLHHYDADPCPVHPKRPAYGAHQD